MAINVKAVSASGKEYTGMTYETGEPVTIGSWHAVFIEGKGLASITCKIIEIL